MDILRNVLIGVATTVVGRLVLYFVFRLGKKNRPIVALSRGKPGKKLSDPADDIEPDKIFKHLNALSPLQRGIAADAYCGANVSWRVRFGGLESVQNKQYLSAVQGQTASPNVLCDVDLDKYPRFKTMNGNKEFFVAGTIDSVDGDRVALQNCTFAFHRKIRWDIIYNFLRGP